MPGLGYKHRQFNNKTPSSYVVTMREHCTVDALPVRASLSDLLLFRRQLPADGTSIRDPFENPVPLFSFLSVPPHSKESVNIRAGNQPEFEKCQD